MLKLIWTNILTLGAEILRNWYSFSDWADTLTGWDRVEALLAIGAVMLGIFGCLCILYYILRGAWNDRNIIWRPVRLGLCVIWAVGLCIACFLWACVLVWWDIFQYWREQNE
jgi:hypothetical protein